MKITEFKLHIEDLFLGRGWGFWFGTFQSYIEKKEAQENEIVWETFEVPLTRPGLCRVNIDVIIYAGILTNNEKIKAGETDIYMQRIDDMVQETVELIESSQRLHILNSAENIRFRYIESNSINNQLWGRFPVKLQVNGFW